ncbi:unnamed protein product [Spirodela intermedia]|uniref:Alpha/beta hydrolase fold-3 domain-containing protein n=1 Tax=Spirodela intermedia TaxID=51605 RepID=A0A7I8IJV3_SPIIN|nr:unnamed protein product [Spirodela intermedia]CAA6658156.1 unnamed protein product [Spirodela intermedia]
MATADDGDGEEAVTGFPYLRRRRDGSVRRLKGTDTVPPSIDSATGVASKDVPIVSATGVSARLYLPPPPPASSAAGEKLPIVVYFHGGGFCIESAASPTYHHYLNSLAAAAPRLPAGAVALRVRGLHPGLPRRRQLRGNIAHNMAMRAAVETLSSGLKIEGLVAVHPLFWFSPAASETSPASWSFLYPSAARGLEEPCLNPAAAGAPCLAALACRRVLVCLAEKDLLRDLGRRYYEALERSGFRGILEKLESEGEGHIFHLLKPDCDTANEMMERVAAFLGEKSSSL